MDRKERAQLEHWREVELDYADHKFDDQRADHDESLRQDGLSLDGFWYNQVFQYWKRADILGINTLAGRQALAKGMMTWMGLMESVIRVHGDLPEPGQPSGYVNVWSA